LKALILNGTGRKACYAYVMVPSAPLLPGKAAFLDRWARAPAEGSTLVLVSFADGAADLLARLSPPFAEELVELGHRRLRDCLDQSVPLYDVEAFGILAVMPDCLSAEALADSVVRSFSDPLTIQGLPIPIRVGVGLRAVEEPGEDAGELLRSVRSTAEESRGRPLGWGYSKPAAELECRDASGVAA
jgi:hypothetical protein